MSRIVELTNKNVDLEDRVAELETLVDQLCLALRNVKRGFRLDIVDNCIIIDHALKTAKSKMEERK